MADCVNALKEWTGKSRATIVFDSTVDEFTHDGLFVKVKGKHDIALVGFTTDGDVFGGFYSVAVMEQERDGFFWDRTIFIFSFESRGRCATPQRFDVKEGLNRKHVEFWKNDSYGFAMFWVDWTGGFWLGNESSNSFCSNMSRLFEGLEDTTLTGNANQSNGSYHHCTRLVAVQLE